MAVKQRKRLGEVLQEWGAVSASGVSDAVDFMLENNCRIGEAMVSLELVGEEDVAKALAVQYDMEYVDMNVVSVSPADMAMIPDELIKRHLVLPIGRDAQARLQLAIIDPLDIETLDTMRFLLSEEIVPVLASRKAVEAYIQANVGVEVSLGPSQYGLGSEQVDTDEGELDEEAAPIVKLVTAIITEGVQMRSSDIHIEPMADRVRVRYRIDGVCIKRDDIPKRLQGPVINRFKILSGLDLSEKRIPLDGRIKMRIAKSDIDFRVSSLPSYHGESIVLRILRGDAAKLGLANLGFEDDDYQRFKKMIKRPNGIFLVTGPTGSGKTTTLYSALNDMNRPDRKIITAEDPVEYNFTGINQCQVREKIGLTFTAILRSMLRQAPNVILVGEIRDMEVADVAIQAALTGHLVFSTLHTNDAPSALTRLIDMGVKPFLVASSIQAVMAQRLVRRICPECRVPDPDPDPHVLRMLGFTPDQIANMTFYKGAGCKRCNGSGYHGRQGIFEMMEMTSTLRQMAFNREPLSKIRHAAIASGMKTLLDDGKIKIRNGITTADELVRITQVAEYGTSGEE